MSQLSVRETADRLGVSIGRVHHRIADGSLPAMRVGSVWIIDEVSLIPLQDGPNPGRPLSVRSTWALLAQAWPPYIDMVYPLASSERRRAVERLDRLLDSATSHPPEAQARLLRKVLKNRARRLTFRASPADLDQASRDVRLTISGITHPSSAIASAGLVEGYLSAEDLAQYRDQHLLSTSIDREANVFLHVSFSRPSEASPLLVAADLAEHRGPREEVRAAEIVADLAASRTAGHLASQEHT